MTMPVPKEQSTQMQTTAEKTVLITGANVGIGKDIARQLASCSETARIYLEVVPFAVEVRGGGRGVMVTR